MLKVILLTIVVVLSAMVLLSVRVILKKDGRFSSKHISQSRAMRDRGIGCATSQHRQSRKAKATAIDMKDL